MTNHDFSIKLEILMREFYSIQDRIQGSMLFDADFIEKNLFLISTIVLVKRNIDIKMINEYIEKYSNCNVSEEMIRDFDSLLVN